MSSSRELDEHFMRRALRLAMNGRGRVEPNPMVGCVIVKDAQVIGEGHHQQYGGPHAEPNALANCKESPQGATAYVTLEPCCHTNKKTPPCAPRLIEAKLARVVIGCLDPNPHVNGKGVAMLRHADVRVDGPVLEPSAKQLIAPFIAHTGHRRPYVTLKWSQTADGKVAGPGGQRMRISNPATTRLVHQLRTRSDGLMIGVNTAINDDPQLSVRNVELIRRPMRIILDSNLLLPATSQLVRSAATDGEVTVVAAGKTARTARERVDQLRDAGIRVIGSSTDDPKGRVSLWFAVGTWDFTHLMVEPGPTLAASFFAEGLCDRLWIIRSPTSANDESAPSSASVPPQFVKTGRLVLDGDTLTEYLNPHSPVFFAPEPSADFVLARDGELT